MGEFLDGKKKSAIDQWVDRIPPQWRMPAIFLIPAVLVLLGMPFLFHEGKGRHLDQARMAELTAPTKVAPAPVAAAPAPVAAAPLAASPMPEPGMLKQPVSAPVVAAAAPKAVKALPQASAQAAAVAAEEEAAPEDRGGIKSFKASKGLSGASAGGGAGGAAGVGGPNAGPAAGAAAAAAAADARNARGALNIRGGPAQMSGRPSQLKALANGGSFKQGGVGSIGSLMGTSAVQSGSMWGAAGKPNANLSASNVTLYNTAGAAGASAGGAGAGGSGSGSNSGSSSSGGGSTGGGSSGGGGGSSGGGGANGGAPKSGFGEGTGADTSGAVNQNTQCQNASNYYKPKIDAKQAEMKVQTDYRSAHNCGNIPCYGCNAAEWEAWGNGWCGCARARCWARDRCGELNTLMCTAKKACPVTSTTPCDNIDCSF